MFCAFHICVLWRDDEDIDGNEDEDDRDSTQYTIPVFEGVTFLKMTWKISRKLLHTDYNYYTSFKKYQFIHHGTGFLGNYSYVLSILCFQPHPSLEIRISGSWVFV